MPRSTSRFRFFAARSTRTPAMPFIMLPALVDMITIGLVMPVLPALVGTFTDSKTDQAFWYGVVMVTFGIANFLGSPILGELSDAHGRRPVLLIGFFGLALNYFATALAASLLILIMVRLVGGAMQANIAVANAYVADITPPSGRAKRFGMLAAMIGVGFVVGPVIGGLLGAIDLRLPFYVAGGLALLNLLYGGCVLPESLSPERRRAFSWKAANPITSLRGLAQLKGAGPLVAVIACSGLTQLVFHTSWVLYTTFKFGWGPFENGWSLASIGIVSAVVQGLLLERILKRVNPRQLAVLGLVSSTLAYLLWGIATQAWMMFVIIFANLLGATVAATIQSIVSGVAGEKTQGKTLGAISALNSLMAVIAPLIGTPLLAMISDLPKGDWRIGAPFYLCAALQATALVLAVWHFRRARRARRPSPKSQR